MPLDVVRELLTADAKGTEDLLERETARRRGELERVERAVAGLAAMLADGGLPEVSVRIRREPARRLAALRYTAAAGQLATETGRRATRATGAGPGCAVHRRLPVDLRDPVEALLGIEVATGLTGAETIDLPAGVVAGTVHSGPVDTVALTWFPLLAWVHERGLEPVGTTREEYVSEQQTYLSVPLKEE